MSSPQNLPPGGLPPTSTAQQYTYQSVAPPPAGYGYSSTPPAPAVRAKHGVAAWMQFLWMYLPIPGIANVAWIAGSLWVWVSHRDAGPGRRGQRPECAQLVPHLPRGRRDVARGVLRDARRAGWTIEAGDPRQAIAFAWVAAIFIGGLFSLIFGIAGAVAAGRGRVYRPFLAIPFLRPRQAAVSGPQHLQGDAFIGR